MTQNFLITGCAGFIGFHLALALKKLGHHVAGIDNLNDYYDTRLKKERANILKKNKVKTHVADLKDLDEITKIFEGEKPHTVINLAAQAGVRNSIINPIHTLDSNLVGFTHILEACRNHKVNHLIYASTSSVYGANNTYPFSEKHNVDHPLSLYGATKKANEALAHSYAHLYNIPATGLRFFTVYGPWGRPDMAYFSFTKKILDGTPIPVFNHGKMQRDFTYIDDIINGILGLCHEPAKPNPDWNPEQPDPASSLAPWRLYNIGNNTPVELEHFIDVLEDAIGIKAVRDYQPMQIGDVIKTAADISALQQKTGFTPSTSIEEGLPKFVDWYKQFYN